MRYYSKDEVRELCLKSARYDNADPESIREQCVVESATWFRNFYLKLHFRSTREYLRAKRDYPSISIDEKTGDIYPNSLGISTLSPVNLIKQTNYSRLR